MSNHEAAYRIRRLTPKDVHQLAELWNAAGLRFKPKGRDSPRNLIRQRLKDPELFLGAFVRDKMVAAVIASDDGRKAWINRLAVAPEARHKGIALRLIERCESILRRRGRRIFCVHVEDDNLESISLFGRAGYLREDEIHYFTKRDDRDY